MSDWKAKTDKLVTDYLVLPPPKDYLILVKQLNENISSLLEGVIDEIPTFELYGENYKGNTKVKQSLKEKYLGNTVKEDWDEAQFEAWKMEHDS